MFSVFSFFLLLCGCECRVSNKEVERKESKGKERPKRRRRRRRKKRSKRLRSKKNSETKKISAAFFFESARSFLHFLIKTTPKAPHLCSNATFPSQRREKNEKRALGRCGIAAEKSCLAAAPKTTKVRSSWKTAGLRPLRKERYRDAWC